MGDRLRLRGVSRCAAFQRAEWGPAAADHHPDLDAAPDNPNPHANVDGHAAPDDAHPDRDAEAGDADADTDADADRYADRYAAGWLLQLWGRR
jgi:hypothetical protein